MQKQKTKQKNKTKHQTCDFFTFTFGLEITTGNFFTIWKTEYRNGKSRLINSL